MIAYIGSREDQNDQNSKLFESMVKSKNDVYMLRYSCVCVCVCV